MNLLLFGTGDYYNRYKIWFEKENVLALIDNSKEKQGSYIDDNLVIAPEAVFQYRFDAVIILSFYVKDMKIQLLELGVPEDKIYHFFDLNRLFCGALTERRRRCYGIKSCEEKKKKNILLLSQDLTLGGPAIALYHAAQVLIKRGYDTVYASMMDGPLRELLTAEGIPVIIDENLMVRTMEESKWVGDYSFIICNTMNFHVFLSERDIKIPVAWWLHDAPFFYDGVSHEVMDRLRADHMRIWSVGPIPKRAVRVFRNDFHVENLLYGVEDITNKKNGIKGTGRAVCKDEKKQADKIRFAVIGYIEHRKGQDILLKAIKKLEAGIRKRAEFLFVGQNTSRMAREIMEASADMPEIIVTGPVDRKEVDSVFRRADWLVCPSREDPMPTVAAEAMMYGIPCLLSDAAGTAEYIRSGTDGIIFSCGDVNRLTEILERCIRGEFDQKQMGVNARRLFEKYFSMEAFEKRFMELVEEIDF